MSELRAFSNPTYWMCVDDFFNWNINDWFADCHHICVFIHIKPFFWLGDITCFLEIFPNKEEKVLRQSNLWVKQPHKQWENLEWRRILCFLGGGGVGWGWVVVTASSRLAPDCGSRVRVHVSGCLTQILRRALLVTQYNQIMGRSFNMYYF